MVIVIILILSSCRMGLWDIRCDYFEFVNQTDFDLVVLQDFNPLDDRITSGQYLLTCVWANSTMKIDKINGWKPVVKDSLHLYIIREDNFDEYLSRTDNYGESVKDEEIIGRMTLTLDDLYPERDHLTIYFPPLPDSHIHTIIYQD